MCGKVGDYIEPLNENDCQKYKKKIWWKMLFYKTLKIRNNI